MPLITDVAFGISRVTAFISFTNTRPISISVFTTRSPSLVQTIPLDGYIPLLQRGCWMTSINSGMILMSWNLEPKHEVGNETQFMDSVDEVLFWQRSNWLYGILICSEESSVCGDLPPAKICQKSTLFSCEVTCIHLISRKKNNRSQQLGCLEYMPIEFLGVCTLCAFFFNFKSFYCKKWRKILKPRTLISTNLDIMNNEFILQYGWCNGSVALQYRKIILCFDYQELPNVKEKLQFLFHGWAGLGAMIIILSLVFDLSLLLFRFWKNASLKGRQPVESLIEAKLNDICLRIWNGLGGSGEITLGTVD